MSEAARFAPELKVVMLTDTVGRSGAQLDQLVSDADVVVTSLRLVEDQPDHDCAAWASKSSRNRVRMNATGSPSSSRLTVLRQLALHPGLVDPAHGGFA